MKLNGKKKDETIVYMCKVVLTSVSMCHRQIAWNLKYQTARSAALIRKLFTRKIDERDHPSAIVHLFNKSRAYDRSFSTSVMQLVRILENDVDAAYVPPGIKQTTHQFYNVLQKVSLMCDSSFSMTDALMLSAVFKHRNCKVQRIAFLEVDARNSSFEFDLVPAMAKCASLRSIAMLGGCWTDSCISAILEMVRFDNPRVTTVHVENVVFQDMRRRYSPSLCVSVGGLLTDFFNYSVPGLSVLSLHRCYLRDSDIQLLTEGLRLNSSLTSITLSSNLLEDPGLSALFTAIVSSDIKKKKTVGPRGPFGVTHLNLSGNFIRCKFSVRKLFDNYFAHQSVDAGDCNNGKKCIEIVLNNNPITKPYLVPSVCVFHYNILKVVGLPTPPASPTKAGLSPSKALSSPTAFVRSNRNTPFTSPMSHRSGSLTPLPISPPAHSPLLTPLMLSRSPSQATLCTDNGMSMMPLGGLPDSTPESNNISRKGSVEDFMETIIRSQSSQPVVTPIDSPAIAPARRKRLINASTNDLFDSKIFPFPSSGPLFANQSLPDLSDSGLPILSNDDCDSYSFLSSSKAGSPARSSSNYNIEIIPPVPDESDMFLSSPSLPITEHSRSIK